MITTRDFEVVRQTLQVSIGPKLHFIKNTVVTLLIIFLCTPCLAEKKDLEASEEEKPLLGSGITSMPAGGKKEYDENTLTVEEIEKCFSLKQKGDLLRNSLEVEETDVTAQEEELSKIQEELSARKKIIGEFAGKPFGAKEDAKKYTTAVHDYNTQLDKYNASYDKYMETKTVLSSGIKSFNSIVEEYNTLCSNKRYYEDDYNTVISSLKK